MLLIRRLKRCLKLDYDYMFQDLDSHRHYNDNNKNDKNTLTSRQSLWQTLLKFIQHRLKCVCVWGVETPSFTLSALCNIEAKYLGCISPVISSKYPLLIPWDILTFDTRTINMTERPYSIHTFKFRIVICWCAMWDRISIKRITIWKSYSEFAFTLLISVML